MDSRTQRASGTVVDPRQSLAMWLRAGRAQKNLSLDDVARITKIQPRILEKLESGQLDGLPAEVFVKGFVRSFAKCVGLPESEAIERYAAAQSGQATAVAKAFVETMSPTVRLVEPKVITLAEPVQLSVTPVEQVSAPVEAAPVSVDVVVRAIDADAMASAPREVQTAIAADLVARVLEASRKEPVVDASGEDTPAVDPSSSAEIAQVELELADGESTATKRKTTRKKSTTAAPKAARTRKKKTTSMPVVDADAASTAEPTLAAGAESTPAADVPATKPSRSRKKKTTVTPTIDVATVDAAADATVELAGVVQPAVEMPVVEDPAVDAPLTETPAPTDTNIAPLTDASLDVELAAAHESLPETTPFTRLSLDASIADVGTATAVDSTELAELRDAATYAMTSEYELELVVDESSDGTPLEMTENLAEGSQRISQSAIEVEAGAEWRPTMPPMATASSAPWRRPLISTPSPSSAYVMPSLVIDDADPDSADREREQRAANAPSRLSFLPPILLDREDRSARQGGLTLAVIILLIAATLTLSYLMRRPSASGDGVTMLDGSSQLYS